MSTAAEADLLGSASRLADVLDSFGACLGLERKGVMYVSTPITTGRRFYDWLLASGYLPDSGAEYGQAHAREVIAKNTASAQALVATVRRRFDKTVVDPTRLDVPFWTQDDFHAFWTRLITDYVGVVVFNDGWEYSTGCCREYAAAVNAEATSLDANLSVLPPNVALMLTEQAIGRLRDEGHAVSGLLTARHIIEQAISTTAREREQGS
ncbi:hypothetical protein [Mycolicibacterium tusciae]|uniref:hypothetical protein n=1 Tax=Mycolicibacterium tusciae TaxID=75922 RepID=UPI00024A12EE|nr:hypothetical protein [Mycolicibacterium tusciae]